MSECPTFYFAHIRADGRRADSEERPELSRGSVELVATKDYMVRPPMVVTHFFLIDASAYAVESGATACACAAIASVLDSIQGGDSTRIGIATFDAHLNFFRFFLLSLPPLIHTHTHTNTHTHTVTLMLNRLILAIYATLLMSVPEDM
jgi:protein transport protein SEC24